MSESDEATKSTKDVLNIGQNKESIHREKEAKEEKELYLKLGMDSELHHSIASSIYGPKRD